MFSLRRSILLNLLMLLDLVTVTLSFMVLIWFSISATEWVPISELLAVKHSLGNFFFFMGVLFIWNKLCKYYHLYSSRRFDNFSQELKDIFKVCSVGSIGFFLIGTLFKFEFITLQSISVFFLTSFLTSVSSRYLMRQFLAKVRIAGRNLRKVVVVGTNRKAYEWARNVEQKKDIGVRIIGFVDNNIHTVRKENNFLGKIKEFPAILKSQIIDEVVIALPLKSQYDVIQEVVAMTEEQGIPIRFVYPLFNTRFARSTVDATEDSPDIMMSSMPYRFWQFVIKRMLDVAIASLLLVVLSPLMILTALIIRFSSKGPVIFSQDRVGLNKRVFKCYKFRSMVTDAEKLQAEFEDNNEMDGAVFKITDDPRVTSFGKFIRKTSIDELPQLFNVLKGEISLVGPRPLPLRDYKKFETNWHRRRFSVLPGITCIWQISGRNNISFNEWMKLDMDYIDNWKFSLDMKILFLTVLAVLRRTGAA
ncbi:sugar transferase [Thermodesulfobacteriota bacterium]